MLQTIVVELELENWQEQNWWLFFSFVSCIPFLGESYLKWYYALLWWMYSYGKMETVFILVVRSLPLLPAPFALHFANWCSMLLLRWPSISFPVLINGLLWIDGRLEEKEIIPDNVDTVFISCHPIKPQLSQEQERRKVERMAKEWESEAPWNTLYQTH